MCMKNSMNIKWRMNMKLLQPNQEFRENVTRYNRVDSLWAFGLFCIMCILYAFSV